MSAVPVVSVAPLMRSLLQCASGSAPATVDGCNVPDITGTLSRTVDEHSVGFSFSSDFSAGGYCCGIGGLGYIASDGAKTGHLVVTAKHYNSDLFPESFRVVVDFILDDSPGIFYTYNCEGALSTPSPHRADDVSGLVSALAHGLPVEACEGLDIAGWIDVLVDTVNDYVVSLGSTGRLIVTGSDISEVSATAPVSGVFEGYSDCISTPNALGVVDVAYSKSIDGSVVEAYCKGSKGFDFSTRYGLEVRQYWDGIDTTSLTELKPA